MYNNVRGKNLSGDSTQTIPASQALKIGISGIVTRLYISSSFFHIHRVKRDPDDVP